MSWSIQVVGKPENVTKALEAHAERLTGQSRQEYDEALPALKTLVAGNVGPVAVSVNASGHASFEAGLKTHSAINAEIKQLYGFVE